MVLFSTYEDAMPPEVTEILKVYGPLAIGWVVAGYLMKFILARYDADIQSRSDLAIAMQQLAQMIKELK